MKSSFFRVVLMLPLLLAGTAGAQTNPETIQVDLQDCSRRLYHAELDIPVAQSDELVLTSPLWIPGSHSPNGPIGNITGLRFTAEGKTLAWKRDPSALSVIHVALPAGTRSVHAHLDAILTSRVTRAMAMLEWESVLLYPAKQPVRDIRVLPSIVVPASWGVGSSLPRKERADNESGAAKTIQFAETDVEQLEDSPVLIGRYFHEYRLLPGEKPEHFVDVAGDDEASSTLKPETLHAMEQVIREARQLFGSTHYNHYHFLLTRSNFAGGGGGLEHSQSTNIGIAKDAFNDEAHTLADADLFAHEFTHSWNGKYRRPAGLYRTDFATPVQSNLLWIYEGLTQYLGDVLATRSGLKSQETFRQMLALTAAGLQYQPGRSWRTIEDTATAVSLLRGTGSSWTNWRRGKDYYPEGELLWLDVDTLLRTLTQEKRSLDDFARSFLGGTHDSGPKTVTYELGDIVSALNQIAPFDWERFFRERVSELAPQANLDGLHRGGYELVFQDTPSPTELALSDPEGELYQGDDFWYSLGLRIDPSGAILDVRWGSPADQAKFAPKQKILSLNGTAYSSDALRHAVAETQKHSDNIRFVVRQDGETFPLTLSYAGGERFPLLIKHSAGPALLDKITAPQFSQQKQEH